MRTFGSAVRGVCAGAVALAALTAGVAVAPLPAAAQSVPTWLISSKAIGLVDGYLGNTTLVTNAFDVASTLESGTHATGWVSQQMNMFDAYGPATDTASFLYAVQTHTIPVGTTYVMYDDESWTLTPSNEQQDPATYMADFVTLAHANGYKAILAPGLDLVTKMSCFSSSVPDWSNYLTQCNIPAIVAGAKPDAYAIQSQALENDTGTGTGCACYKYFVDQSVAQADKVSTISQVMAGLSTNPGGNATTAQTLDTDTQATLGTVSGFWLNVPEQGTSCPTCQPGGVPQVAAGYLWLLGYVGPGSQTITLTAPATGTFGAGGTLSATGGPSGNPVTFSTATPSVCTVSGSAVAYVSAGSCVVDANQAGSTDWLAAPQVSQTIAVAPAPQAIDFPAPAGGVVGGTTVLSATGGASGNPVTFTVDATSGAGVCSVSGTDGADLAYTGAGTCVVDANEAGTTDYAPAPQVSQPVTVGQGTQAILFTAPPSGAAGTSATLTATGGPSGEPVTFTVDASSEPGVCSVSGPDGSTVSYAAAGSCVVDANQAGNVDYLAAPEVTRTISVGQGTQTVTFTSPAPAGAVFEGPAYAVTATGGLSGNPVVFSSDTAGVCTASGASVSFVGVGTCTVAADQAGNANFAAAPEATQSFPVAPAPQTITFTSSAPTDATFDGASYTVAAAGGASGNPVTFSSLRATVCTVAGLSVTFVGAGTCTVAADQAGDADYAAAPEATQSFTVAAAPQAISFTSLPPPGATFAGPSYTVAATGGASGNPVTFSSLTAAVCTVAGASVTFVGAGSCSVAANQAGSSDYAAAPQVVQSFAVAPAAQAIGFTPPGSGSVGQSAALTASGGGSGNPVTFTSATPTLCTVSGPSGSTVTYVAVGTCVVDANEAGSANYLAAPQESGSIAVGAGAQSIKFTSSPPANAAYQGSYAVAATGGGSGNAITFSSTTPAVCTVAGAKVSFVGVGTCTVAANQAGNANWLPAPQATQSFPVAQAAQVIAFTSKPPNPAKLHGGSYKVTATGGGSANAVVFTSGSAAVCSVSGSTVSFLAAGTCVIDANQAGGADWLAAPQATQSFAIKKNGQNGNGTVAGPAPRPAVQVWEALSARR